MKRRAAVLASLVLTAAILAVPALAATRTITVGDNYFVRKSGVPTVTVKKNDRARFAFRGERPHNVKVKSGPARFTSPIKKSGTWTRRMTRRGTYRLYCSLHGAKDQSMVLRVR